jgi:membrane-bound inhibitor of C-type lysozyme
VRRVMRRSAYLCEGDAKLIVSSSGLTTRVIFKDHIYNLKPMEGSSGAKYSNGSVIWSLKDEEGSLEDGTKSGKSQLLAKGCHLQQAAPSIQPVPAQASTAAQP